MFEMSVVSHVLESLYCQYLPVSDGKWKDLRHLNRSIKRNILFTRVHTHFYVDCCLINFIKTNRPILMQIGTSGPQGNSMKRTTFFETQRNSSDRI